MPTASRNCAGRAEHRQRCSYTTCPSLQTLNGRSSIATFGHWWSVQPCSRHHTTGTRPPTQSGGHARSSQTPQSTSSKGAHPKRFATPPAASRPNLAPAAQRPPVRGRLSPNYDACNVIHSRQLACRGANVDRAAANAAEAHQLEGEHEEAPPGVVANRAIRTATRDPVRTAWAHRPSVVASRKRHSHCASGHPPISPNTLDEPRCMVGRLPARLSGRVAYG
jgi:hypothetical protein